MPRQRLHRPSIAARASECSSGTRSARCSECADGRYAAAVGNHAGRWDVEDSRPAPQLFVASCSRSAPSFFSHGRLPRTAAAADASLRLLQSSPGRSSGASDRCRCGIRGLRPVEAHRPSAPFLVRQRHGDTCAWASILIRRGDPWVALAQSKPCAYSGSSLWTSCSVAYASVSALIFAGSGNA